VSDQASSTPSGRQVRSSVIGGLIFGLLAIIVVAATGLSWTLGIVLVLAGLFGPALLIRRGARLPDERVTSEVGPGAPSARTSKGSASPRFRLLSWKTAAIAVVLLAAFVQYQDRRDTEKAARSAVLEELGELSDKGWTISTSSLPVFTLFYGSKDVEFILNNGDLVRTFKVTVHGNCFAGCTSVWSTRQTIGM